MTPRPALSDHFRPPTPPRPAQPLPKLELLRRARRNLLEMFSDKLLNQDYSDSQVLFQRVIICNSPETVQAALVGQHAAVERKSPQMRHALEPLLGDGLFISDGPVWAQRRRMVAPVVHVNRLHLFAPVMVEVAQEAAARWAALPAATPVAMLEAAIRRAKSSKDFPTISAASARPICCRCSACRTGCPACSAPAPSGRRAASRR
jgi:cytochrome P450